MAASCEEPVRTALLATPDWVQDLSLCLGTALRCPRGCATAVSGSLTCWGHVQSVAGIKTPCSNDGGEGVPSGAMSKCGV